MARASERKRLAYLRKEAQWIQRGAMARSTKSRERIERFEKLSAIERIQDPDQLKLGSLSSRLGNTTIEIRNLSKAINGQPLITDFSYIVRRHERLGIIGPNGCGKSTLMKLLVGQLQPDAGKIIIGETVRIGYFSQAVSYTHLDVYKRQLLGIVAVFVLGDAPIAYGAYTQEILIMTAIVNIGNFVTAGYELSLIHI